MAQQQYGYGYGYGYGYTQPAASGYVGYTAGATPPRPPTYTPSQPAAPQQQPPAQQQHQHQQPQQPNVGYTSFTPQTPQPSNFNQQLRTPQAASNSSFGPSPTMSRAPVPQTPSQQNYQGGYSAYKPQTPSYTPYYQNAKSQTTPTSTPASSGSTGGRYRANSSSSSAATSSSAPVGYPSYSQSSYASSANAYYKQMKENKTNAVGQVVAYQPQQQQQQQQNLTPVQQQVVRQYIHQKSVSSQPYQKKKVYTPPTNAQTYYCEVCRISCASQLTYQTHLDGKSHKKKVAQQKSGVSTAKSSSAFYCELCDVLCSNKDGLEAHMRGAKHNKVVNLHRKMGKPIPVPKTSTPSESGTQKTVMVTAPRISFVGGKQLSSTAGGYTEAEVKVYPPTSSASSTSTTSGATGNKSGTSTGTTPTVTTPTVATPSTATTNGEAKKQDSSTAKEDDEPEPEPVGENLVEKVSGDPKFPHACFKCQMCDCYFNDEFAKKAHVKGRRHRLNFKKMYQPDLYVEPTKAMKKEIEKRKKQRELIKTEIRKAGGMRGGWARGRGRGRGGGGTDWSVDQHRQDTLDLARKRQRDGSFSFSSPMGPPMMQGGFQHRNPRDDKLVLNKHSLIYPNDEELKAVDGVVNDVEKALKIISDDLLTELSGESKGEDKPAKDESNRQLKGVMRVGAFARGLLLKGECSVELILMTSKKPNFTLFMDLASKLPAKFEELKRIGAVTNTYNVTPDVDKAAFTIISQVADFCISVSLTLTSTMMREEPSPEQAKADADGGVLDRPSCLAALAALRHTKWFQAMAHHLPSCIVTMRVLKDICRRVPAWGVLDQWILQLLVQKCIVSANSDFTRPGDVFRRIMECVGSGLFLPGGPGLYDPCEKDPVDAAANLTAQERANITLSAQHALRLIAFDKLHLVLGVDPLPPPTAKTTPGEGSTEGGEEGTQGEGVAGGGTKRDADSTLLADSCKKIKLEQ